MPLAQTRICPVSSAHLLCRSLKHRLGITSVPSSRLPSAQIFKTTQRNGHPTELSTVAPASTGFRLRATFCSRAFKHFSGRNCAGGAGLANKAPASSFCNSLLIKKSAPKIPLAHSFDIPHFIAFGWIKGLVVRYMNSINI